jgi:hypothetical protein
MIRFACPSCSAVMSVTEDKAGKTGKCPKCQAAFLIPVPGPAAAPPPLVPPPSGPPPVEINPCPGCQGKLTVAVSSLGIDVSCPYCQTVFRAVKAGGSTSPPKLPPRDPVKVRPESAEVLKRKRDDDEDDEEDDRPRRRRRRRRDADDDDDSDVHPVPRRSRRVDRAGGKRTGAVTVRKIDIVSSMKIQGAICFTFGLLFALLEGCLLAVAGALGPSRAFSGILFGTGILFIVVMPVIYGVVGAIGGLIFAVVYNVWAAMIGGLELELE